MASKVNDLKDIKDSAKDVSNMKEEVTTIDLPDVADIPGQENIKPAPFGDLGDTTIASADEEGDELFDDNIDEEIEQQSDSNVSAAEKKDLQVSANDMPTQDDRNLREAALDSVDEDGTPLNEGSFDKNITASDLDIPGAADDDANEDIGEEDEENNEYSVGGDDNDDIPEDNF